jgi:hypothetical protein
MKIASEHAERERERSGMRVKEWLLFRWVALYSCHVAGWHHKPARFVIAHAAYAVQPRQYHAAVSASEALNPVLFEPLVYLAFDCMILQDVF